MIIINLNNSLNVTQKKIWKYLLSKDYVTIQFSDYFSSPVSELISILEFNCDENYLRETLLGLMGCIIKLNFYNDDNVDNVEYHISPLIERFKIKNGTVTYKYGHFLVNFLANTNFSNKFDLLMSENFSSKHTKKIFEICISFYDVKTKIGEKEFSIDMLRKILEINNEYKDFKFLNKNILKKAAQEINEKTSFNIELEYRRKNKKTDIINIKIAHKSIDIEHLEKDKEDEPLNIIHNKKLTDYFNKYRISLESVTQKALKAISMGIPENYIEEYITYMKDICEKKNTGMGLINFFSNSLTKKSYIESFLQIIEAEYQKTKEN